MQVDETLLNRLEKLSYLKISQENREGMEKSLSEILEFVDTLKAIDVSGISATASTLEGGTSMQDDEPSQSTTIATDILKNAPSTEETFFIVPKIIE